MKNISEFKAKMTQIGSSRYILIPNRVREFEGINDDDILNVIIQKLPEEVRNEPICESDGIEADILDSGLQKMDAEEVFKKELNQEYDRKKEE